MLVNGVQRLSAITVRITNEKMAKVAYLFVEVHTAVLRMKAIRTR